MAHKKLTKKKARTILGHGEVRGHELTKPQKGFFKLMAFGKRKKVRKKTLLR